MVISMNERQQVIYMQVRMIKLASKNGKSTNIIRADRNTRLLWMIFTFFQKIIDGLYTIVKMAIACAGCGIDCMEL